MESIKWTRFPLKAFFESCECLLSLCGPSSSLISLMNSVFSPSLSSSYSIELKLSVKFNASRISWGKFTQHSQFTQRRGTQKKGTRKMFPFEKLFKPFQIRRNTPKARRRGKATRAKRREREWERDKTKCIFNMLFYSSFFEGVSVYGTCNYSASWVIAGKKVSGSSG